MIGMPEILTLVGVLLVLKFFQHVTGGADD